MQVNIQKINTVKNKLYKTFSQNVVGQSQLFETLLIGLFSGSHVLLESVPGLAKTRAAMVIAKSINGQYRRVQFTPDLMPSDIIGNKIYNIENNTFTTQVGPIFGNVILADEINRAPAKVQSALLEAMQEKQISIGGDTIDLPKPFFVIATQNPIEQEGTYALPEAQLDRFIMKDVLTYPNAAEEKTILDKLQLDQNIKIDSTVSVEDILEVQQNVKHVAIDESIKKYIVSIVEATRTGFATANPEGNANNNVQNSSTGYIQYQGNANANKIPNTNYIEYGASPRASIGFMTAAQVSATLFDRDYVTPDDIKSVAYRILRHRLILNFEAESHGITQEFVIQSILDAIPTP